MLAIELLLLLFRLLATRSACVRSRLFSATNFLPACSYHRDACIITLLLLRCRSILPSSFYITLIISTAPNIMAKDNKKPPLTPVERLQALSLVTRVTTELSQHLGLQDKTLAEFVISLAESECKAALKKLLLPH